jgi:hypothetical protein
LIEAGADIYEKIPDGRSALDLCDDPDIRTLMIDFREQCIRNHEKAVAAAAAAAAAQAAQLQQKPNPINLLNNRLQVGIHSLPNGTIPRAGALYESRSSISSPYGSGSSLNRTSSIRRASLRDREKVKKLNDNFLDVLQAKDKIQEDVDENTTNTTSITNGIIPSKTPTKDEHSSIVTATSSDSTIREPVITIPIKKSTETPAVEIILPPLKVPPPLPPPPSQTIADTLSDVKRRREERRRIVGGPSTSTIPPPLLPAIDMNNKTNTKMSNGNHLSTINDPMQNYSAEKYIQIHGHIPDEDREKRICCTIL